MKKSKMISGVMCAIFLFAGAGALQAKGPGGHGPGGGEKDSPRGFEKGEKKGWDGESTPPGWRKGKKKGWGNEHTPPGLRKKKHRHEKKSEDGEKEEKD